jgi:hypothetical protein
LLASIIEERGSDHLCSGIFWVKSIRKQRTNDFIHPGISALPAFGEELGMTAGLGKKNLRWFARCVRLAEKTMKSTEIEIPHPFPGYSGLQVLSNSNFLTQCG